MLRASLALAAVLIAILVLAGRADAFIYWTNSPLSPTFPNTIGRANLDGTGVTQGFVTGLSDSSSVAVDSAHLYWSNSGQVNTLGRANLDGTHPDQNFITGLGVPTGVAVDAAHIYWTEFLRGTIGRANIDGTGNPDPDFIAASTAEADYVAVDGAHVYWTTFGGNTIGRANLDGSDSHSDFITGAQLPTGIAVDSAHIYWANAATGAIGRANLDGTQPDQSFIKDARSHDGMAVDGSHIYWANTDTGNIARATLDGKVVDLTFMTGLGQPTSVATDTSLTGLIASVQQLGLPHGTERSLLAKLDGGARCGPLGAFINETRAQSGKKIVAVNAAALIANASATRDSLGCNQG